MNTVKPPDGYKMKTIFIRPTFEERIANIAELHGLKKYAVLNSFFEAYWNRYETNMNNSIKRALESYKKDLERGDK